MNGPGKHLAVVVDELVGLTDGECADALHAEFDLASFRNKIRHTRPALYDKLLALALVAERWRARALSRPRPVPATTPDTAQRSPLTATQVADLLGVHARTVQRHCAAGKLNGRLVGGRWLIDRKDLAQYRREQT